MKVGVLGAGVYGVAMAGVLRENRHRVKFYDPYKYPAVGIDEVVAWAEVLLLSIPASAVSGFIKMLPKEAFNKPLIITTKGVMNLEMWDKFQYYEIVSGPGFADEIRKRKKTKLTVSARGALGGVTLAEDLLSNSYIKFDKTEDVAGVAMLSGLKNIYAIEAGRQGLVFGSEDFKAYIYESAQECERFLLVNGGFVETVRLSAGLGDLVLTCGSDASRNYQFGQLLGGRRRILERKRLARRFLKETTVEGVTASRNIESQDFKIPTENEILKAIIRRIKDVVKR